MTLDSGEPVQFRGMSVTPVGHTPGMSTTTTKRRGDRSSNGAAQLVLLDGGGVIARREWQLDEKTRRIGRVGVAQARAILRDAHPADERRAS